MRIVSATVVAASSGSISAGNADMTATYGRRTHAPARSAQNASMGGNGVAARADAAHAIVASPTAIVTTARRVRASAGEQPTFHHLQLEDRLHALEDRQHLRVDD